MKLDISLYLYILYVFHEISKWSIIINVLLCFVSIMLLFYIVKELIKGRCSGLFIANFYAERVSNV